MALFPFGANIKNYRYAMGEADIDFYLEQIKHTKNDEEREDLLNNCCKKFINDSRYKNDARYIKCWIELANYVDEEDSLKVNTLAYSFLHRHKVFITMNTHGIGLQLAIFYLGFATVLESTQILDNLRTAIIIYEKVRFNFLNLFIMTTMLGHRKKSTSCREIDCKL